MSNVHTNLSECIGQTPVIELIDPLVPTGKHLFLKIEALNPGQSIKDRTALGMVRKAFARGTLKPGGLLIESTSGNLGKSFAMLGAIHKFRVLLVVDPKVSQANLNYYRAFGAEVVRVTEPDETGGFQKVRLHRVKELLAEYPDAYWPNQYDNPDNSNYHFTETGSEMVQAMRTLHADAIVGCVSTGGHMTGIGRYVKLHQSEAKVVAVDIEGSNVFGGGVRPYLLNGVGLSWRSENTDPSVFDRIVIGTDLQAISMCHLAAKEHGLLIGGSSGLVIVGALKLLRDSPVQSALAILPDSGVNYLDQFYDPMWLETHAIVPLSRQELESSLVDRKKPSKRVRDISRAA